MDNNKPILGTTIYSFTNEWLQRMYTLEEEVQKVAELGLGPAVEIVGFQSLREYPDVSDESARHFRELLDRHGLIPSCLGGNCHVGRDSKHLMTEDETVAYVERQIVSAEKLGFPVLRIQGFVGPKVFERLAPAAERSGVQVAGEVHSPLSACHPEIMELRECFDRVGPELVGFVPDFSSSMSAPPDLHWKRLRDLGAPEGLIDAAKDVWASDKPVPEKFGALAEAAGRLGLGDAAKAQLNMTLTMFGRAPVEQLAECFPTRSTSTASSTRWTLGRRAFTSLPEVVGLAARRRLRGTISAEWEGTRLHRGADGVRAGESVEGDVRAPRR